MKEIINYSFAEVISCTLVSVAVGVKYMMEIDYYLNKKPQPFHSCGNMKYLLIIHHKAGKTIYYLTFPTSHLQINKASSKPLNHRLKFFIK